MEEKKRISAFAQWKEFTVEYFQIMMGDKKNLIISLLFPVLAVCIIVFIAGNDFFVNYEGTKSGNFVFVSAAIWGGLFNSIQVIVKDRKRIKRNYMSGARIGSYTLSRAVLQLILCLVQSLILIFGYVGVEKIKGNSMPAEGLLCDSVLLEYFVSVFLVMYAADTLGILISCIVKKAESANVMAPYILIVQLIFSGILFELKGATSIISKLMISSWGMEALGSISRLNEINLKIQETVPSVPHEFEDKFYSSGEHLLLTWIILLSFCIVCIFIGNLLLHRVSKDTRE